MREELELAVGNDGVATISTMTTTGVDSGEFDGG